jgi:predicted DNA-binding protein with PD1-like motif
VSGRAVDAASFASGRSIVANPPRGSDLLAEIERLVLENDIDFCRVEGIGSLSGARMTFYDQSSREDREIAVDRPMMLLNLSGTALRSGDDVLVHCHFVLGDVLGMAFGGDLSSGCAVFSCELILQELDGPPMARSIDAGTGLARLQPAQTGDR